MDVDAAAARFERSTHWSRPCGRRDCAPAACAFFPTQRLVNAVTFWPPRSVGLEDLRDLLADSTLRTLPLLMAGSSPVLQEISAARLGGGARSPALQAQLAAGALARRDYAEAARLFAAAVAAASDGPDAIHARIYQTFALLMADRAAEARAVLNAIGPAPAASVTERQSLRWLHAMLPAP